MAVDISNFGSMFSGLLPSAPTVMGWLRNLLIIIGILVIGAIVFAIMYFKKKNTGENMSELGWWEEINDRMVPLVVDQAEEIIIPGTSLRVFYIKKKDMWLPRFTRAIKPKLFWIVITPNRELVNWIPKPIGRDMIEAGLDYDHTDMRWAAENTKEFIKRNYRDKSTPWWQAYMGVISGAIYILVTTFCLGVILYLWKGITTDQGVIIDKLGTICTQWAATGVQAASGVVQIP